MKVLISNIVKLILAILVVAGCSKSILEETPPHLISSESLYITLAGFESGLNGLYNLARTARWKSEQLENVLNGVDNMCSNYGRSSIFWNWGTTNSPADADITLSLIHISEPTRLG